MGFIVLKNAPVEWTRSLSATRGAERALLRAVKVYLGGPEVTDAQLDAAIDQGPDAVATLMAGPDADAQLLAEYTAAATTITEIAETGAYDALGIAASFTLDNPYSAPWILSHGAELVQGVGDLTREAIRQIVAQGFTDHYTVAQTARKIRGWVGLLPSQVSAADRYAATLDTGAKAERALARYVSQLRQQRAVNIARTETINAHAQGTLDAWRNASDHAMIRPGAQKEWIAATASDRTCPICMKLDGQKVPLTGSFVMPGGGLIAAPTAHPSCRCALALTWK
jgi:hypothetical protein